MMMLNEKKKMKKEFEEILDAAALEIIQIWRYSFGTEVQIKCRFKAV